MENAFFSIGLIKDQGINGSPLKGGYGLPMVATRDIGGALAGLLEKPTFSGHSIHELLGPRDYAMRSKRRRMVVGAGLRSLSRHGHSNPGPWRLRRIRLCPRSTCWLMMAERRAGRQVPVSGRLRFGNDVGCLLLLRRLSRCEGIRFADLFGVDRSRLGREVLWGLAYLLVLFPVVHGGTVLASCVAFGTRQADFAKLAPGLQVARRLPSWAVAYSFSIFWVLWSPTEEVTYQAYCAARLRALTGRTSVTLALVGFWWALQHSVLPLVLDWRLTVFRFLQFLPLVVIMQLLYLRTRRLPRMIVMHWPMDLLAARMTLALLTSASGESAVRIVGRMLPRVIA
jgi:hypothetical protein